MSSYGENPLIDVNKIMPDAKVSDWYIIYVDLEGFRLFGYT